MADFSVRSDHIDVEQIMRQIRARIRDKRGADYTEAEIRELASVKLDKFLDPRAVRSDLLQHYRRERQPAPLILPEEAQPPLYEFNHETVYASARGVPGKILTIIRKILKPFSKLFFHVDTLWDVLAKQSRMNATNAALFQRVHQRLVQRDELDALNFEMFNNLVVELTRLGIENKNLRMQVESFGTRLDFDERRARALEGVVQYRPGAPVARPQPPPSIAPGGDDGDEEEGTGTEGDEQRTRRRRRRRGRRRGEAGGEAAGQSGQGQSGQAGSGQRQGEGGGRPPGGYVQGASAPPVSAPASSTTSSSVPLTTDSPSTDVASSDTPVYTREPEPRESSEPAPAPEPSYDEPAAPSDRPAPVRVVDTPRPPDAGDPESSAS